MRVSRFLVLAIAALGGVLCAPADAFAHSMNAKVTITDEVKVEAYFEDDFPAEFAEVKVIDTNGKEVLAGKTDERGVWTFPKPAPGSYTLAVTSLGHVATVRFQVEDEPGAAPVTHTNWRLNKFLGLGIGLVVIFGISAVSWLIRRRKRG